MHHTIIFRASSSELRTLLPLAERHTESGGRSLFAVERGDFAGLQRVRAHGFEARIIRSEPGSAVECDEMASFIRESGARSVVIASSEVDAAYIKGIASHAHTTVIDSGKQRALPAHLIVNSDFAADERFYTCRADAVLLLGPSLQIVPSEISDWPKPPRVDSAAISRFVVATGDDHATARILDNLPRPESAVIITVLATCPCPVLDEATRSACARGYIIEQIGERNLLDSLLYCDGAVVSPEISTAERAFFGVPSLTIALGDDDQREAIRLAEEGANFPLPPMARVDEGSLQDAVTEFIGNERARAAMGRRLSALVDGKGADRILDCIADSIRPRLHILGAA